MSTFLQLCSLLTTRSGAIGAAPTTVIGQTGRQAKCVDWIMNAYTLIQNDLPQAYWLQGEVSAVSLTISTMSYTSTALGVASRFSNWKGDRVEGGDIYRPWTIYNNSIGQADETELREISYQEWRRRYDRNTHDATRPIEYAIAPDGTMRFGPKPDIAYKVRGEYVKTPQVLAVDADTPEMPDRFHDAIVWRAIMLIGGHDEADPAYQQASAKYGEMMLDIMRDQLPPITLGGSALA